MKVEASLNNYRRSSKKVMETARILKGLDANVALWQLDNFLRSDGEPFKKLILSAIANAENNFGLDRNNLYILEIKLGAGPTLKRWMPRAYGRAARILKRTCNVTVILEEKVVGKKVAQKKAATAKEKVSQVEAKESKEAKEVKEDNKEEKGVVQKKGFAPEVAEKKIAGNKGGWNKKVFRRKSA